MTSYPEAFEIPERIAFEEYVRRELVAEGRHEFHDGVVLAMLPSGEAHAIIGGNALVRLHGALRGTPHRLFSGGMRMGIVASNRAVFPDATIVTGPTEFHPLDRERTTVVNPRVIFEVTSEATERYDRAEKFEHYKLVPSFEEYVLIAQARPEVEVRRRGADGAWREVEVFEGFDAVARVQCVGVALPLAELYADLTGVHGPAFAAER